MARLKQATLLKKTVGPLTIKAMEYDKDGLVFWRVETHHADGLSYKSQSIWKRAELEKAFHKEHAVCVAKAALGLS